MPKLIATLLRHGHYEQPPGVPSAHLPHPLTSRGTEQARAAVPVVVSFAEENGLRIDRTIDTSSLLRAWQTASLLAEGLTTQGDGGFTVAQFDALAERGIGAAANLDEAEIERIVARDPRVSLPEGWRLDSRLRLPFLGAETLMEAGARVLEHLERRMAELREASEDTLKVFVGHGGGFRHAAIHMGLLTVEQMPALSMEYCQPVHLEYRGPGKWSHLAGDWKIRRRETPRD